jgi:predicted N-acetyltransferase YhbS
MSYFFIRTEQPSDYQAVEPLIRRAFVESGLSDGSEAELVAQLRQDPKFIPELSIIATHEDLIIGHVLLTPMKIGSNAKDFLALAPVSVLPEFQKRGVGKALIEEGHKRAKQLGFSGVVVVGHGPYYASLGYSTDLAKDMVFPFEVPSDSTLYLGLNGKPAPMGEITYLPAFGL